MQIMHIPQDVEAATNKSGMMFGSSDVYSFMEGNTIKWGTDLSLNPVTWRVVNKSDLTILSDSLDRKKWVDRKSAITNKQNSYLTAKENSATNMAWAVPDLSEINAIPQNYRTYSSDYWISNGSVVQGIRVKSDGSVENPSYASDVIDVRAISKIKPSSILFVSRASGGKVSNGVGPSALTAVGPSSNDNKLTLKDSSQTIVVNSTVVASNNVATINYNKTGYGTKISAIVTDSTGQNIISYGNLADVSPADLASQEVEVQLPVDFFTNNYKLKVFSEMKRDDNITDYAGNLADATPIPAIDVVINYKDNLGTNQIKAFNDIAPGTDLTQDTDYKNIMSITATAPTGWRKADTFWTYDNSATAADFSNVTKSFTATANYVKTYDVTFKYRKADHVEVTNEKLTVDTGTNLSAASKLPFIPSSYTDIGGVKYRYNEIGDHWKVTAGSGTITNVTSDMTIEAPTTKQVKTTIKYRNESKPEEYISNDYWLDTGSDILGNIPSTSNPYLPILLKQIKGYRLKEQISSDKTDIWKSSNSANALGNITQPSTIQPDYIKNWEVVFKKWDDTPWDDLPWKNTTFYIDDGTAMNADQIPTPPYRPFYNFVSWSSSVNKVTADSIIKPLYSKQSFEIRTDKELDAYSSTDAKNTFTSLDNDGINSKLDMVYNPQLYSGGILFPDQTGMTLKLKNADDYAKLKNGEVGKYTVSLNYINPSDVDFTANHEVILRITDDAKEEAVNKGKIAANNFALGTNEVGTVDQMFYATYAGALAFDKDNKAQLVTVKDASNLKREPGIYPVIFKAILNGNEVTTTVNVTVKNSAKGQELSSEVKERIAANDIVLDVDETNTIRIDKNKLMELAQVSASNVSTGEKITNITVEDNDNITAKRGNYPIRFRTANGTMASINVYVRDGSVVGTSYQISANDFSVSVEEAKTATNETLKTLGNALATDKTTGTYGVITIDKGAFKAEKGTFAITYKAPDNTAITINATVVDNAVEKNSERISANNFSLSPSDANSPSDAKLISSANAQAINSMTGANVTITSVDKSKLKGSKGNYPVSFATATGTSVTVYANVADSVKEENGLHIEGNHFSISKEEVKTINNSTKVVGLSGAKAYVISSGSNLNVTATGMDGIVAEAGSYPITLTASSAGKDISLIVNALICDEANENPAVNERITGNYFMISKDEVTSLTDADVIARGNVKAIDTLTGKDVDVKIKNRSVIKAEKGVYSVEFTTDKNTAITLNVKVVDDVKVTGETRISGNDFCMPLNDFSDDEITLNNYLINAGSVKAVNANTGNKIEVEVKDKTILKKVAGTYLVTYVSKGTDAINTAELTLTVIVQENGKNDGATKETITANNIHVTKDEVKDLDKDRLIALSGVKSIQNETGREMPIITATHNATAKKGEYKATFTTAAGTSMDVKVIVTETGITDTTKKESISGNDFKITIEEIIEAKKDGQLNELVKTKANVRAVDLTNGYIISTTVDTTNLLEKKGSYEVSFTTGRGTSITVNAIVVDNSTQNPDPSIKEAIYANDFSLSSEEYKIITNDKLIQMANARAEDTVTGDSLTVNVKESKIQDKAGVYDVTYKTVIGTEITVKATLQKAGNVDGTNKESIHANDFYVSKAEAATASDALLITRANANAVDENGYEVEIKTVEHAIQDIRGRYEVTFKTDKGTNVKVKAYVSDEVEEDTTKKEIIIANDFYISVEEVKTNNDAILVALSSVKAFDTRSGKELTVSVLDKAGLQAKKGTYPVKFKTVAGTEVGVQAHVMDNGTTNSNPDIKEAIYANNFVVKGNEVAELDDAKVKTLSSARAISLNDGSIVDVTKVDYSSIKATKGNYDVIFETTKGTSVTVKATVQQNSVINEPDQEEMYSSDFALSVDAATDLLSDADINTKLMIYAQVKANVLNTATLINVQVKEHTLEAKQGVYTVTFETVTGNTEIISKITVTGKGEEDTTKHERISANDFTVKADEVKDLTKSQIIALARAEAMDTSTGDMLEMSVDSKLEPKKGTYDVAFATVAGTTLTIKATVTEETSGDNEDLTKTDMMFANDFSLSVEEAKTITETDTIKMANVKAFEKASGAPVSVTIDDINVIQNKPQGNYEVTFKSANGSSIAVTATITKSGGEGEVENPEDPTGPKYHERISANDFSIEKTKVAGLSAKDIIGLAKAKAVVVETSADVEMTVVSGMQAKKGVYNVTFSTVAGTTITVTATITDSGAEGNVDPDIKHNIYANDFSLSVEEAKIITSDILLKLANAKASEKASGAPVTISVDESQVKNKPQGRYAVKYTTDKTSITVYGTVTKSGDSGEVENPDNPTGPKDTIRLSANDFSINKAKVSALKDEDIIALAKASAVNETTGADVEIKVESHLESKKGIYDVKFSNEASGATIFVKGTVTDSGIINPDPGINESIYANDFSMSVEEASKATETMLIEKAKAKAYDDKSGAAIKISADVSSVKGKLEGTYDVTFKTTNNTKIHVSATITGNGGTANPDPSIKEAIYASDFTVAEGKVDALKDKDIIMLAKAKAVNTETGSDISIDKIISEIKAETGIYNVTFETTKGTKVTVKATVTNAGHDNSDVSIKERIYANRIIIDVEEARAMSNEDIIKLSKARAINTETGANVDIYVIKNGVQAVEGMYQVRIGTVNNTVMDIQVTVTKNGSVNPNPSIKEKIYANDFAIGKKDAAKISDERLIQLAKASAVNIETGQVIKVSVKENTIKGKGVGEYEVIFTTEKNTSVKVKGTVQEEGIINDRNSEVITAQNFTISAKGAKIINDNGVIEKAKAKATDISTGGNVELKVKGQIGTGGEYPIVFETEKGTKLSIIVTVIPEDQPVIKPIDPSQPGTGGSGNNGSGGNNEKPSIDHPITNPDGSIDVGGGTIIKPSPDGKKPTINDDGTITIPKGGSVTLGDKEIVFKDGGIFNKDMTMSVVAGSTVTINGKDVYFKYGGTINLDGTYTMFKDNSQTEDRKKTKKDGITLKETILPIWMLIYAGGYAYIQRKKEEE